MKRVGVTGGIGSGKSLVCSLFEHLGVPVYEADTRANELIQHSSDIHRALTGLLGEKVYRKGKLNKTFLARVLFSDAGMREQINQVVHPVVFKDFLKWSERYKEKPYVIQEAAIIFESGAYRFLDDVINVYAPVKMRIARLLARDSSSTEEIRRRMHVQMTEKNRRRRAGFTIINDGERMILPQVVRIHNELLK